MDDRAAFLSFELWWWGEEVEGEGGPGLPVHVRRLNAALPWLLFRMFFFFQGSAQPGPVRQQQQQQRRRQHSGLLPAPYAMALYHHRESV